MSVGREIAAAAQRQGGGFRPGDALVLAQKIVSKPEGRALRPRELTAGAEAAALADQIARPASLMQLMLDESVEVLRAIPAVVITRHRTGHVAANAGIDAWNVPGGAEDGVLLWPKDPDASARYPRRARRADRRRAGRDHRRQPRAGLAHGHIGYGDRSGRGDNRR